MYIILYIEISFFESLSLFDVEKSTLLDTTIFLCNPETPRTHHPIVSPLHAHCPPLFWPLLYFLGSSIQSLFLLRLKRSEISVPLSFLGQFPLIGAPSQFFCWSNYVNKVPVVLVKSPFLHVKDMGSTTKVDLASCASLASSSCRLVMLSSVQLPGDGAGDGIGMAMDCAAPVRKKLR